MIEFLQVDSVASTTDLRGVVASQDVSSIWMWIAIIEGCIILLYFLWGRYKSTTHYQMKTDALQENLDLGNIFDSAFNAEPLYKELFRVCHPDRFAPDENKMAIADELFQRIAKNRNNIKELQSLKEEVKQKLNIKL